MSQTDNTSLWQKIKQLLTTSVTKLETSVTALRDDAETTVDTVSGSAANNATTADHTAATRMTASGTAMNEPRPKTDDHSKRSKPRKERKKDADMVKIHTPTADEDTEGNAAAKNSHTRKASHSATPITTAIKHYLDNKQWHYTQHSPKTSDSQQTIHVSLRMRNQQIECGYLFRVQEKNRLLAVYGILPFVIPDSHKSAAMLLITQINYNMIVGNLEMDVDDGEIRYKNAIDVEAVGINDTIIEHLLQSVVAMTTVTHGIFGDLVDIQDPAADMTTLLDDLQQQADARTFFLPTQLVQ